MAELFEGLGNFWSNHWQLGLLVACVYLLIGASIFRECFGGFGIGHRELTKSELKRYEAVQDEEINSWISTLDVGNRLVAVRLLIATKDELADPSKQFRHDVSILARTGGTMPAKLANKFPGLVGGYSWRTPPFVRTPVRAFLLATYLFLFLIAFTQLWIAIEVLDVWQWQATPKTPVPAIGSEELR